jgi:hypothetical protein
MSQPVSFKQDVGESLIIFVFWGECISWLQHTLTVRPHLAGFDDDAVVDQLVDEILGVIRFHGLRTQLRIIAAAR